ncbi:MAG: carboxymuconolactone decarboxylase family protein [Chloroflexi bacterium]|nr:carboxymuconolactone decarboxylase family protein [Chloroflexota bacterium]
MIEKNEAPAELAAIYDRADSAMQDGRLPGPTLFGNQIRALAHHPALLQALIGVYEAFAASPSVERKLMELGVLICSRVNACDYCLQHHAPLARASGLNREQLWLIQQGTWSESRDLWSEQEWLVIRYAEQMTREPQKIADDTFAELRKHFDDRQIVDMTMRFALCSAWNKFNDALALNTELAFRHAYAEIMVED